MKRESQIDAVLRLIGDVSPPAGLERRIQARLEAPRRGFSTIHSISAIAIAASVTIAALALSPGLRELALHDRPAYPVSPRTIAHPVRAFGGASATHVPTAPIPVQPTPVSQGRGHSRSARSTLPGTARPPLPRGVALPPRPQTRISALPSSLAPAANSGQQ